jgi:TPR repeat protein
MDKADCWATAFQLDMAGDTAKAIDICQKEPCSGQIECQRYLGWVYYQKRDLDRSYLWYSKGAEGGDGEAMFGLGCISRARENYAAALDQFKCSAVAGYPRALHYVGEMYERGLGAAADSDKAKQYYMQSAEHGFLIGERQLLFLRKRQGGMLTKCLFPLALLYLSVRAFIIALRHPGSPRVLDIPNAFSAKQRANPG